MGCKRARIEFIRVYSISLSSLIVIQIILLIILSTSIEFAVLRYSVPLSLYISLLLIFECISVFGVYFHENNLLSGDNPSNYYMSNLYRTASNDHNSYRNNNNNNNNNTNAYYQQ